MILYLLLKAFQAADNRYVFHGETPVPKSESSVTDFVYDLQN